MECTEVSDGDLEDFSVVQKILLIIYPEDYSAREDFKDFSSCTDPVDSIDDSSVTNLADDDIHTGKILRGLHLPQIYIHRYICILKNLSIFFTFFLFKF
jgi:hypothetical protein